MMVQLKPYLVLFSPYLMQKHHFQPFQMKIFWGPIGGLSMNGGDTPLADKTRQTVFDSLTGSLIVILHYGALFYCLLILLYLCALLSSSLVVLLSCCLLLLLFCRLVVFFFCCLVVLLFCCFLLLLSCSGKSWKKLFNFPHYEESLMGLNKINGTQVL